MNYSIKNRQQILKMYVHRNLQNSESDKTNGIIQ